MTQLIIERYQRILKNKKRLEQLLNVKISVAKENISTEGYPEDEYIAEKVIQALDFGFPFQTALMIKQNDFMFEILKIKDYTPRKDLERIRARIIGKAGKSLSTLSHLTQCFFELKDNFVGIIGAPENIKNAQEGINALIRGSKHGNVYSYLEKHQVQSPDDLGLKE